MTEIEAIEYFGRMCALAVLPLWDAPPVVGEYLRTGRDDLAHEARIAARRCGRRSDDDDDAFRATWATVEASSYTDCGRHLSQSGQMAYGAYQQATIAATRAGIEIVTPLDHLMAELGLDFGTAVISMGSNNGKPQWATVKTVTVRAARHA